MQSTEPEKVPTAVIVHSLLKSCLGSRLHRSLWPRLYSSEAELYRSFRHVYGSGTERSALECARLSWGRIKKEGLGIKGEPLTKVGFLSLLIEEDRKTTDQPLMKWFALTRDLNLI